MLEARYLLGIGAALLSFSTCPLYLHAVFRGRAKPNRVTWWVLAAVSGVIAWNYYLSGAHETLWLPIEYVVGFLAIAITSIWWGEGSPRLMPLDIVCLAGAGTAGYVWWLFDSAPAALSAAIATEFIGLLPTIHKVYLRPESEDRLAWIIATGASALNVLALPSLDMTLAGYPIYVLVTNAAIIVVMLWPRRPLKIASA